jgi:hypothetical protein
MTQKASVIRRAPTLSLPVHELADIMALKALNNGEATPEQQIRALLWITKSVCMIGGLSYDPDNSTATYFNEGRRYVGVVLTNFIYEPVEHIRRRLGLKTNKTSEEN